ncbi:FecR family protein [Devosia lacusdianchii]|uniref:FecR family protein n=1 Tax=Devosia lacusdianchii TaxID=2917991 RepID=UPI001F060089|nr:FecR domain-containing protein [Devosia sp. JXJ CY 41]
MFAAAFPRPPAYTRSFLFALMSARFRQLPIWFISRSNSYCQKQGMMKNHLFAPLLALGLTCFVPAAFAAGEGTAVGVKPDALARINSQDRMLVAGTDVSVGELIVTGPAGQVQVVFQDNTRLVVGPGSSLLIETYLMASNNTAQKLAINALGGSFRFITGNSPKPAYSITTPTAAIAVRGTEFDLIVSRSGTYVMLYEGALQICNSAGDCQQVVDRCDIGVASPRDAILYQRSNPDRAALSEEFRYARVQAQLLPPFRVSGVSNCVGAPVDPGPAQSLNSMTGGGPNQTFTTTGNGTPTTGNQPPTTGGPTVP